MKSAIVSINDITKDNPTLCLSALRALGECQKCATYINAKNKQKLKCTPKLTHHYIMVQVDEVKQ